MVVWLKKTFFRWSTVSQHFQAHLFRSMWVRLWSIFLEKREHLCPSFHCSHVEVWCFTFETNSVLIFKYFHHILIPWYTKIPLYHPSLLMTSLQLAYHVTQTLLFFPLGKCVCACLCVGGGVKKSQRWTKMQKEMVSIVCDLIPIVC